MLNLQRPTAPTDRSMVLPPMIPLEEILRLRLRLAQPGILFPQESFDSEDLSALAGDPALELLSDYKFSDYSMEPTALAYLKEIFTTYKPKTIVELGSGISTAILSYLLRSLHGPDAFIRYVTIDQSQEYVDQTWSMIEEVGTTDIVKTIVADTKPMTIHGRDTACYDIKSELVAEALDGHQADLIIVDGPVGGGTNGVKGARFATVPLLRPLAAHQALFFLDDALRDTELEIAVSWSQLDYLQVLGLKAVGKGTLVGCYLNAA